MAMAEGTEQVIQFNRANSATPNLRVVETDREQPYTSWSDEALMLEHGHGSETAYEELVSRHQRGVLNYIYRMVNNRQIAEELTQEVFLALVKNAQRYQPTAKFTTYLYAIASNVVSKEWARQKRRPKFFSLTRWFCSGEEEEFNPTEHVGDAKADVLAEFQRGEISEAINAALKYLPEHQREAFILRRFQDVPYEEIARILDVPIGTVKSRVVRAERALRPYLEKFREYV
jgi:RNA polymerase sigma-70 factor (ECF subfamily)